MATVEPVAHAVFPGRARLVRGAVDEATCRAWLERLTELGPVTARDAYPPSYRNNERLVVEDGAWAEALWEALRAVAPQVHVDAQGRRWRLRGLNPRLRACRYRAGQRFTTHRDGPYFDPQGRRSFVSVVLYLDSAGEAFEGGDTRFFLTQHDAEPVDAVQPRRGDVALFDHDLWHDGAPVLSGTKHVLRSDLLYELETPAGAVAPEAPGARHLLAGHHGYVWDVLALADGRLASSGRDGTARLWRRCDGGFELGSTTPVAPASVTALAEAGPGLLACATRAGEVSLWRLEDAGMTLVARAPLGHGAVLRLVTAGPGLVAASTAGGQVALLDAEGRVRWSTQVHDGWTWGLTRAGAGALLTGDDAGHLARVELADGAVSARETWRCGVRALATSASAEAPGPLLPGGLDLLVGDAEGRVSRVVGPDEAVTVLATHEGAVTCVVADGAAVLSGGEDGVLAVDGGAVSRGPDFVRAVARLPTGALVTAGYDGLWLIPRGGPAAP